ncbi:hypothetical protein A2886_00645 [candidate division WWE3 bacterium RIFCSPHIGHO2_01_FULL_42_13]|uniref:Uncharacterized protein n=1 Tax=candidate division WWE3 bacterium RIFCSPHIGHO2_01_FULL_42_13 TaxID=1802617 RepID=A0A1F4UQ88_UNCKA|nr:MAG: hypothetical protein A2886_00645 [candidate division WWE3 bacterium RIFCSPHIGHO2_01_FULL_42_13]
MNFKKLLNSSIAALIGIVIFVGRSVLLPFEKIVRFSAKIKLKPKRFPKLKFKFPKIKSPIRKLRLNSNLKPISKKIRKFYKKLIPHVLKIAVFAVEAVKKLQPQFTNLVKELKKGKKSKIVRKVRKTLKGSRYAPFVLGIIFSLLFIYTPFRVYIWYRELPRPELLSQVNHKSTRILDRQGHLLYEIYVDKNYDPVSLDKIPQHVIQATLAIEDRGFYSHIGVDFRAMLRAAWNNLFNGGLQGGSTITQQLVKNVLLDPERTISRKTKEIVVALMAEQAYTKDEILEMYLNNISYGGTAWGIQSASQKFFGKNVEDLNLAEAAFLAGLPSSPSSFSPFTGNVRASKQRQTQVLEQMVELGYASRADVDLALAETLNFSPQTEYIRAPHFVNFIRDQLEHEYGTRLVNLGGLTITTTLDLDLQNKVQDIVTSEVVNNSYLNFSNGAALVLDSRNGEVLSYVGSTDFFSDTIDGEVDIITAFRQPGSSIKPLTYALALENGFTPATVIEDEKITFSFPGSAPYTPVNYDGRYHGKVTLRQALANSYNIPAVKVANTLGPDKIVEFGKKLGFQRWEVDGSYGISITLGGKEIRLLDLANLYATFARSGEYKKVEPILSIKDANGYEIYNAESEGRGLISKGVSYLISNILSDNNARSAAFGPNSTLVIPGHQVAVKTGTTDSKRDNWTFGYTPSFTVGTWVGNNDNTPMNPILSSGLSGASPIWNKIMLVLLEGKPNEPFEAPSNVFVKVDPECDNRSEVFVKGSAPAHLCDPSDDNKKDDNDD